MEGEGLSLVGRKTWLGHSLVGLGPRPLKYRMWFLLNLFELNRVVEELKTTQKKDHASIESCGEGD